MVDMAKRFSARNARELTRYNLWAGTKWLASTDTGARGAPPLEEGKVYQAGGPEISVPEAVMRFTIRNGKPVRLPYLGAG